MYTGEKTPEQLMRDFTNGAIFIQPQESPPPDFHTMALLAAQTLPNKSINEILANAEKIEYWLNEPMRKRMEMEAKFRDSERDFLNSLK